jgi:hypothetical protein
MPANRGKPSSLDQPVARPRRVRAGNREPHDVRVRGMSWEGARRRACPGHDSCAVGSVVRSDPGLDGRRRRQLLRHGAPAARSNCPTPRSTSTAHPCWARQTRTSTVANSVATTNSPASRRRGSSDESPQPQTEQAKGYRERNITRMTSPAQPKFREVVGSNGRVYRTGETDRDILGRSRAWMVCLPWAGMMRSVSSSTATAPPRSPYGRRTAGACPRRSGCFPFRRAMALMSSA